MKTFCYINVMNSLNSTCLKIKMCNFEYWYQELTIEDMHEDELSCGINNRPFSVGMTMRT